MDGRKTNIKVDAAEMSDDDAQRLYNLLWDRCLNGMKRRNKLRRKDEAIPLSLSIIQSSLNKYIFYVMAPTPKEVIDKKAKNTDKNKNPKNHGAFGFVKSLLYKIILDPINKKIIIHSLSKSIIKIIRRFKNEEGEKHEAHAEYKPDELAELLQKEAAFNKLFATDRALVEESVIIRTDRDNNPIKYYLILEEVLGENIFSLYYDQTETKDYIVQSPTMIELLLIIRNTCSAIRELHNKIFTEEEVEILRTANIKVAVGMTGVTHFDIKPENLMLQSNGSVKIVDFGLSHCDAAPDPDPRGTPYYAAPEIFMRNSQVIITNTIDLFSALGMFIELAGGRYTYLYRNILPIRLDQNHPHLHYKIDELERKYRGNAFGEELIGLFKMIGEIDPDKRMKLAEFLKRIETLLIKVMDHNLSVLAGNIKKHKLIFLAKVNEIYEEPDLDKKVAAYQALYVMMKHDKVRHLSQQLTPRYFEDEAKFVRRSSKSEVKLNDLLGDNPENKMTNQKPDRPVTFVFSSGIKKFKLFSPPVVNEAETTKEVSREFKV